MPNKKFSLETIKDLIHNISHPYHRFLRRFYIEILLVSETIDNSQSDNIETIKGFYLDDRKIEFNKICFLRFENDSVAKVLDGEEDFFYRSEDRNPKLFYHTKTNNSYYNDTAQEYKNVDIDEIYYKTTKPKKTLEIRANSYIEVKNPKLFENRKTKDFPIGVKYKYIDLCDSDTILFFDNNFRVLRDKSLLFEHKKNSNIAYYNGVKVTLSLLKRLGFKEIVPLDSNIIYNDKTIKTKQVYYLGQEFETYIKPKIGFKSGKNVFKFLDTVVFKDSKNTYRAIVFRNKITKKKEMIVEFENTVAYLSNLEKYKSKEYHLKLRNYSHHPIYKNYIILYKYTKEKEIHFSTKNVIYKETFNIAGVDIFIYPKNTNLNEINLNKNTILMEDVLSIDAVYFKVLYRLRNSIAHAEFEINKNEVLFFNNDKGKVMLRAKIDKDEIDNFINELIKGIGFIKTG